MDIFKVVDEIFDFGDLNKGTQKIFYFLPQKFSKDLANSVLFSSIWTLDKYYDYKKISVDIGFQHSIAIREIIKNSRWHGGSKDNYPTYFGLFMDRDKFCLGCNDGGLISKEKI